MAFKKGDRVTIGRGTKEYVVTYIEHLPQSEMCTVMSVDRWKPGRGMSPGTPIGTTRTVEIARLRKVEGRPTSKGGQYAQVGDEGCCARCARVVEFRQVATDALTNEPVCRWVAVRKTKHAPIPVVCPNHNTGGPHRTETHSANGSPLPPRSAR